MCGCARACARLRASAVSQRSKQECEPALLVVADWRGRRCAGRDRSPLAARAILVRNIGKTAHERISGTVPNCSVRTALLTRILRTNHHAVAVAGAAVLILVQHRLALGCVFMLALLADRGSAIDAGRATAARQRFGMAARPAFDQRTREVGGQREHRRWRSSLPAEPPAATPQDKRERHS